MSSTQWPYEQSNYPDVRKPRGFWQDEKTIEVLQQCIESEFDETVISEAQETLRVADGDVKYYARLLKKTGTTLTRTSPEV